MDLLLILALLFVCLWLLVTFGERWLKPPEPGQMAKLSRMIIVLMGLLLLAQGLRMWLQSS